MKTQQDDRALVAAACQGNKQAFGLLIERHMGVAVRVAQRMLGEREGAQDLAQEAFLQAYLSLDQLQQPDHFANWLYGIVLNVCRSARRNRRLNYLSWEALTGGLHFDSLTFASPEPGPQEIVEANELIACARRLTGCHPRIGRRRYSSTLTAVASVKLQPSLVSRSSP